VLVFAGAGIYFMVRAKRPPDTHDTALAPSEAAGEVTATRDRSGSE